MATSPSSESKRTVDSLAPAPVDSRLGLDRLMSPTGTPVSTGTPDEASEESTGTADESRDGSRDGSRDSGGGASGGAGGAGASDDTWVEPVLRDNGPTRLVLFPIPKNRATAWKFYKKARASDWNVEEVDMTNDVRVWAGLDPNVRHYVEVVLAFFASSDAIVNENIVRNFYFEIQDSVIRQYYASQIQVEAVHSEMYALMIQTLLKDDVEKQDKLLNAITNMPTIGKKAEWALRWTDASKATFAERVIAFMVVEGIFFSGSFCAIFWLKKRGLGLDGLCFSNELISRDEGVHCEFAVWLFSQLERPIPESRVHEIVSDAVVIEKEFVRSALPVKLIGMNADLMEQYIEFVADFWLSRVGMAKLYNSANPFSWMTLISLQGKTNFFEKRVGEYSKAGVSTKVPGATAAADGFSGDVDF